MQRPDFAGKNLAAFLSKPFDISTLEEAIPKALG